MSCTNGMHSQLKQCIACAPRVLLNVPYCLQVPAECVCNQTALRLPGCFHKAKRADLRLLASSNAILTVVLVQDGGSAQEGGQPPEEL